MVRTYHEVNNDREDGYGDYPQRNEVTEDLCKKKKLTLCKTRLRSHDWRRDGPETSST